MSAVWLHLLVFPAWWVVGIIGVGLLMPVWRVKHSKHGGTVHEIDARRMLCLLFVLAAAIGPILTAIGFIHSGMGYYGWSLSCSGLIDMNKAR